MFENPTKPDYDLWPVSYFKRSIRNVSLDVWNQRYNDGATASTTKMFLPDAKLAYGVVRKFTATSVTTQVMTGHGGFSEYLNRFKCKENPGCACDPDLTETVQHILFECPIRLKEGHSIEQDWA